MSEYLIGQGFSPDEAAAYAQSPEVAQHLLRMKEQEAKDESTALETGYSRQLFMKKGADGQIEYKYGAPTNQGGFMGDDRVPLDLNEWQPVNPFEKSFQTTAGGNAADAASGYPGAVQSITFAVESFDNLSTDPDLDYYAGLFARTPEMLQTTGYRDWASNFKLAAGNAFKAAFASLKGGGPISEREGQAAQEAILAINETMSPTAIRKQLATARRHVLAGLKALDAQTYGRGVMPEGTVLPGPDLAMPPATGAPTPNKRFRRVD